MSREELAWAAGFFDGEGCTSIGRKKNPTGPPRLEPCIQIHQSRDEWEILQRFQVAVGVGNVRGPYANRKGEVQVWVFSATGVTQVNGIITQLWPFLSEPKKRQAMAVFKECEENRLERLAFPGRGYCNH